MECRIVDFSSKKTRLFKPVWIDDHLSGCHKPKENQRKRVLVLSCQGSPPLQIPGDLWTLKTGVCFPNRQVWPSVLRSALQTAPNRLILNRLNAVFWLGDRTNRVFFILCFSISRFCSAPQITVFPETNPGHYQAPIRTGNLRSASHTTVPNKGLSPGSLYLNSEQISASVFCIRPILPLFKYRQAPVQSKIPWLQGSWGLKDVGSPRG